MLASRCRAEGKREPLRKPQRQGVFESSVVSPLASFTATHNLLARLCSSASALPELVDLAAQISFISRRRILLASLGGARVCTTSHAPAECPHRLRNARDGVADPVRREWGSSVGGLFSSLLLLYSLRLLL